jgi:hypothetical protein
MLNSIFEKKLLFWVNTAGWFFGSLGVLLVVRWAFLSALQRRGGNDANFFGVVYSTLRWPSVLWSMAGALAIGLRFAELTPHQD